MTKWIRDIEGAPRDGSPVLIEAHGWFLVLRWNSESARWVGWECENGPGTCASAIDSEVTGWIPIPS